MKFLKKFLLNAHKIVLSILALAFFGFFAWIPTKPKIPTTVFIGTISHTENTYDFKCPKGVLFSLLLGARNEEDLKGCKGTVQIIQNGRLIKEFSFDNDSENAVPASWLSRENRPASRIITWKNPDADIKNLLIQEEQYVNAKINIQNTENHQYNNSTNNNTR